MVVVNDALYLCISNENNMAKIKRYIYIGIAVLVAGLSISLWDVIKEKDRLEKEWNTAMENVKSYSEQFSDSENKNKAFKLTIEQLKYSNDSIFKELDNTRKELKVKDSRLRSLLYSSSSFSKADTVILKDTVFKDSQLAIDTLLYDEWYSVRVGLTYPSTVAVKPEFKSIKNIVVSSRRETVNPPKKFFLFRWFQKKHTVLNIDVIEKNPYVKDTNNRYVEIVK